MDRYQIALPTRHGGAGYARMADIAPFAFVGSYYLIAAIVARLPGMDAYLSAFDGAPGYDTRPPSLCSTTCMRARLSGF